MSAYIEAGYDPSAFWGLSPRLYAAQMAAAQNRIRAESQRSAWLAWHIAALQRQKTLPDPQKFINGKPAGKSRQSPEVISAMGMAMARAFGAKGIDQ